MASRSRSRRRNGNMALRAKVLDASLQCARRFAATCWALRCNVLGASLQGSVVIVVNRA
jgi:hypothetical protein